MKYKTSLATLLLSAALLSVPAFAATTPVPAAADKHVHKMHCEHEHLSKEKRELLHSAFEQVRENDKDVIEQMHSLLKQKKDILSAQTFDKDAFLSVEDDIQTKKAQLEKDRTEAFASIADQFTPEERAHIGWMLGHHHRHHWHHGDWKGSHHKWKQGKGREARYHYTVQKSGADDKGQTPAEAVQTPAAQ